LVVCSDRSAKVVSRAKDSLRLEDDTEPSDDTDSDTSILLYNLVSVDRLILQYDVLSSFLLVLMAVMSNPRARPPYIFMRSSMLLAARY